MSSLADFEALLPQVLGALSIPGMAVSVQHNGAAVLHKAYGVRTLALPADDPANALKTSSIFDQCSVTKAFTAAAVGVLVHQSRLKWSDKVTQHLPEFALPDELATRDCTVLDLLSHGTGIEGGDTLSVGTTRNAASTFKLLSGLRHLRMNGAFRDAFNYSNNMFGVATILIERVSGSAYPDFVMEHILDPLGMKGIWCTEEAHAHSEVAQPHEVDVALSVPQLLEKYAWNPAFGLEAVVAMTDPEKVDADSAAAAVAAIPRDVTPIRLFAEDNRDLAGTGFLFTSADDMLKWAACWLNGGKAPSGQQVLFEMDTLTKVQNASIYSSTVRKPTGLRKLGYTCGWMVEQFGEYEVLWHGGGMPGYSIHLLLVPAANISVYIATNQSYCGPFTGLLSALVLHTLIPLTGPDAPVLTSATVASMLPRIRLGFLEEDVEELQKLFGKAPPPAAIEAATPALPAGIAIEDLAGVYQHPALGIVTIVLDDLATGALAPRLRIVRAPATMREMFLPLSPSFNASVAANEVVFLAAPPEMGRVKFTRAATAAAGGSIKAPTPKRVTGRAWVPRQCYDLHFGEDGEVHVWTRMD
ncbi:beta-lactamase/transpeptidase-like protein [Blastocladiella britannica]|nr:beta-lactamase/transpeptidase-like protein [Blastocladiella britannica]